MSGLKYTVVVRHPETFQAVALLAGQPVPAWAKDLVHADDIDSDTPEVEDTQPDGQDSDTDGGETADDGAAQKPAGNATEDAWREYALANGKSEDDLKGLGRNEIRDLFA